ncbi:MAG: penicillin-binding protein 2 [Spirochaetaceae bacterium]|jgi:penicillin-binding protein 2|nr:penicillin-binding protein 2 [Spirochaetaceae bacterium]
MEIRLNGPENNGEKFQKRILLVQAIFITIFALYAGQLFAMQILDGELYRLRADDISKRTITLPAQRGEIFDRNYEQPVVFNIDSFAVVIAPAEVKRDEIPALLDRLAGILRIPREQIDKKLPHEYYHLYRPIEIASNIPYNTIAVLAENLDMLPGVSWQSKPVRNYRDTGSLSHVIGYVGNITKDELTVLYNHGYKQGDIIGKAGIEKQYNELLRGREGREIRTVDVNGRLARNREIIREAPEMGKNLVLTIDGGIQTLAEKALGNRIGSVVVLKPASGEILAMVSYPWYDPGIFNSGDSGAEYQLIVNDVNKPLLNRAIQSGYPPGSTFKIIMTTGILGEDAFPPEKTVDCQGEMWYGERNWRCHIRRPGHGRVNLERALSQSCDIYFWVVGRDNLGIERIVSYARDYGLGELTGIDLPGEIAGFIPTPQWKERRLRERWQDGDTMNMSIGQGYTLVTPLQMANIVAMTVNDGVIYKPHILKDVRNPVSGVIEEIVKPEVLHESDIDKSIFETVRTDMRSVISSGTARFPLNIEAVEIAGKTGTSEVGLHDRWHSWFAAYAPYNSDKPDEQVVVSVIVEAVNTWEWWATYASAIIFQGIFAGQTYEEAVAALRFQHLIPMSGRRE